MNLDMRAAMLGQAVRAYLAGRGAGSKTPVAFLYNGVQLPALPEWDKTTYPYAFICLDGHTGYYWLWLFTEPLYRSTIGFILFPNGATGIGSVYKPSEHSAWPEFTMTEGGMFTASALWANHDILNEDGSVYLAKSDPVPVYE